MNALLVAVAAPWDVCLRELLARRGHTVTVIDDPNDIGITLEQTCYTLAFVCIGNNIGEAVEICRKLRATSNSTHLQILACGNQISLDKLQALCSSGVSDYLLDSNDTAEIELRLNLAEFRASSLQAPVTLKPNLKENGGESLTQAEKAIQIGEQNLQTLFESLQDMCIIIDFTGRILHANRSLCERSGYSYEELLEMNITDLHPPERCEDMRKLALQIEAGNNPVNNIPVLSKDGRLIPMIGFGSRGKWAGKDVLIGVGRDMSERQRTLLALHETETRFRAIFENAAIGLAVTDMTGTLTVVNGALAEMLGFTALELMGKNYTEFTHPEDFEAEVIRYGRVVQW